MDVSGNGEEVDFVAAGCVAQPLSADMPGPSRIGGEGGEVGLVVWSML